MIGLDALVTEGRLATVTRLAMSECDHQSPIWIRMHVFDQAHAIVKCVA